MDNKSGRVSFLNILTFIFIILKVMGVIEWSWWLVLAPTLVPIGIVGLIIIVAGIISLTMMGDDK